MLMQPGYQINEKLYESQNSQVYRAVREADNGPVVLKMLREAYPSPERIAWFKREYEVTRSLNLPGVIDVYDLETSQNRWLMVLEDFGTDSLELLGVAGQLDLADFLTLAINVADILGQIHCQHIIHKNVNPSNIVLNPTTSQVKLIDFGISTVLSQETPTFHTPDVLEGTLAYISPEQTGRMNRVMDYRTDLYSLGASFYELLTGQLPFPAADPLEVLHSHIAKQPPAPHELNPTTPQPISEIVLKLLAKNAEDRYQSAYRLKADLEECQRQWQALGRVDPFPLGRQDVSEQFQLPQKLYGREAELETLLAAFQWVSQGACEMMLVAGYAGIGKTALVQEVYRPITRQRGYFVAGKFDQLQRNIPYAALIQAFRALVRLLLMESEIQIAAWREQLLAALGPNGQVVIDVIPEVELILGPQPEVPSLAPAEAQNRFNLVFQNFIGVFARPEHPLVVFLDDLQWVDGASLKLIQPSMAGAASRCLFIIGAYRDAEVSATHPLSLTLKEMEQAGAVVNHIALTPLDLPNVIQFVADTLHCAQEPGEVKPLAELVLTKTGGNPFFMGEFLKSLYVGGLIAFDHARSRYGWDMERIRARGVTDNVVDLMVSKIQQLDKPTQHALRLAACIGNRFDLETLAIIGEKSPRETALNLRAALVEGLVLPLSDAYKLMESEVAGLAEEISVEYRFAHDRIQQAAYILIPETERDALHLHIGRLLLANRIAGQTKEPEVEEHIFEIVNHLNQGRHLITDDVETLELIRLNLLAGQKAKTATAYQSALDYLTIGTQLLPDAWWRNQHELMFSVYKERYECEYLTGHWQQAEALFDVLLQHAQSNWEKADVYNIRIVQYTMLSKYQEALTIGRAALKLLDMDIPEQENIGLATEREAEAIWRYLDEHSIASLVDLPITNDPEIQQSIRLMSNLIIPTIVADPAVFKFLLNRLIHLTLQYGNTRDVPHGYAAYGVSLATSGKYQAGYEFGQLGIQLSEKFGQVAHLCRTSHMFAMSINHWRRPVASSLAIAKDAFRYGLESGEFQYAGYALGAQILACFTKGNELANILDEVQQARVFTDNTKNSLVVSLCQIFQQFIHHLQGRTRDPLTYTDDAFDEAEFVQAIRSIPTPNCYFHIFKMCSLYYYAAYSGALRLAEAIEPDIVRILGNLPIVWYNFFYSLTLIALYPTASPQDRLRYKAKLGQNQQQLRIWADNCADNFQHKYLLVEAEIAQIEGRSWDAVLFYRQAIEAATRQGFQHDAALAHELTAKFWLVQGEPEIAQLYLRKAHYAYQLWGAAAKVKDLEQRYPQWLSPKPAAKAHPLTDTLSDTRSGETIDFAAVLKASQAISGEIALEKLLTRLMEIVIENAGAETGLLLFKEGRKWLIKAEGGPARQTFPAGIINYVTRTKEPVVLSDAAREGQFTRDSYIVAHQPKSVLCAPLINQGRLVAILYLENNLAAGAFTPNRLEVLQLLSAQAAISIENATLYLTLEQKVAARTAELEHAKALAEERGQAAEEARRAAEEANRAKSVFLANMSHELRTPLNAILGFSQLIAHNPSLPPEHHDNLNIITTSGEHLLTLINQVLDLSKVEAGKMGLEEKEFDLYRLLDDLEGLFQLRAADKSLRLVFDRAADVPQYIRSDEVKLRQVLINLLSNAVKFTQKGEVFLRVQISNSKLQIANGEGAICYLQFEIQDTGPGIAPAELAHLFEAFSQTQTGLQAHEGTGLGLAISQRFVQLLGGEIRVESQVEQGATFTFEIPVRVVARAEVLTQAARLSRRVVGVAPDQPVYRLLIVDDRADNRQLLVKLFAPLGFELQEAENGQQALEIWQAWQPQLIWLDMRIPVLDGWETTRRIKATPQGQKTVVVALTASAFEEDRATILAAGCDDFMRKPLREADIFETLERHLGVRFVYEEIEASRQAADIDQQVEAQDLKAAIQALPVELLDSLENAVTRLDMEIVDSLIAQIRDHNAAAADELSILGGNFEYDRILGLIQKARENDSKNE